MKRVVLFLLLFLSLTAPIFAQGDDPEPLDVTSMFDYFEISYPESWTWTNPEPEDPFNTYFFVNDPELALDPELSAFTDLEPGQALIQVSIAPMEPAMEGIFGGRTFDYYLGFVNALQIASNEDQQYWLESVTLSDRTIAGFPGRSVLLQSNFNTIEEIVYFDEKYIIFASVWTASGERTNPTINAILDSIKLVDMRQKIGRLKQAFEGDLSGISLAEGTPVVITNEIEAQEITSDGITSNIWYEVEEICGTSSALMWSGAIQLEDNSTNETTYVDYCIEYVSNSEVPQKMVDEVKAGIEKAYLYVRQFDVQLQSPLLVEIYEPPETPTFCGFSDYGKITIYFIEDRCPLAGIQLLAAHEFIHHIQYDQAGEFISNIRSGDVEAQGPTWLIEGMAEYLALRMFGLNVPRRGESLHLLPEMETPDGFSAETRPYDIAGFAVSLLIDGNDQLLFDYYSSLKQSLNQGGTWKTHFEETFGISVEDFYARFE